MDKRGFTRGKLLMGLGSLLILAACMLYGYNLWDDNRASQISLHDAQAVINTIEAPEPEIAEIEVMETIEYTPDDQLAAGEYPATTQTRKVKAAQLDGAYYMGLLSLPKLDRVLPVQAEWSMAKLKRSPCRYYGEVGDNLVVAAHNYKGHFGGIEGLKTGDEVVFTAIDGKKTYYEVAEIYTVTPDAVDEMVGSGYDLTLFTCTYGARERVTVRCIEISE